MEDLFAHEEEVIKEAKRVLAAAEFDSPADAARYERLLDEYRKLLKQIRTMVKMSDKVQWKLSSLSNDLEVLSNADELTGLYNRRFFNEVYQKEWDNALGLQIPLGMLMIDIDYFKKYNDTYGHLQGDLCLKEIAAAIRKAAKRSHDFVARFGGEEFVVLLPETTSGGCVSVAGEILANVASLNAPSDGRLSGKCSVSIGVSSLIPNKAVEPEALLKAADEALYRAKDSGRNCCRE